MKIEQIQIKNYRLLKDFKLDLEESLSLILGKNNTGKTSILSCLDKFINNSDNRKIQAEDFNNIYKDYIKEIIESTDLIDEKEFNKQIYGITLRLVISYGENDSLANIGDLMRDLELENNKIVLGYDYSMHYDKYLEFKKEFRDFKINEEAKKNRPNYKVKDFDYFLKKNIAKYFKIRWKSLLYDYANNLIIEENFIDLEKNNIKSNLKNIISFKYISAKRDVTNKENEKTLSGQTSMIYETSEKNDEDEIKIEEFKEAIEKTDDELTTVYEGLFSDIIDKISQFGGMKKDESKIKIISTLQSKELLKGNTTVIYDHEATIFPEHYNGLGYMNLLSMIFEIEILINEFKRSKDEKPADINLLFIEEPEAHTHPQMQYVFIKNITNLLDKGIEIKQKDKKSTYQLFQYVISTHSSHIVSNCDNFDAIKYLKKESVGNVKSKNLKDLEKEYKAEDIEGKKHYKFLKQYLTLNRAELFFADKAIFIEGDTERILLPAMMKKIDLEENLEENELPIQSQNISIVEVGAYSSVFENFIDFIGIKSIIITDIDSYYEEQAINKKSGELKFKDDLKTPVMEVVKCSGNDSKANKSSNTSLHYFFSKTENDLDFFKKLNFESKRIAKNDDRNWEVNQSGNLVIIYQTEESGYHARSFEDSFFHVNYKFICDNIKNWNNLRDKWLKEFKNNKKVFELAEKGVIKKPSLAMEILLNSENSNYSCWKIPNYIKEGLLWLRKD